MEFVWYLFCLTCFLFDRYYLFWQVGQSLISSLPSTLLAALACFPPLVKAPPQVQHNPQNDNRLLNISISAAFVQWTRHLSTSNYSRSSSLHCIPLHHCLCWVRLQSHLAFINCQVRSLNLIKQIWSLFFQTGVPPGGQNSSAMARTSPILS